MLTVDTTALSRFASRLQGFPARAGATMRGIVQPLGGTYLATLQAETPRGQGEANGRNRLVSNYTTDQGYTPALASYRIRNQASYLRYVIRGRPAVVAHGRALRFVIGGRVIFRKRVGPAAANNFPARAKLKMQARIERAKADLKSAVRVAWKG